MCGVVVTRCLSFSLFLSPSFFLFLPLSMCGVLVTRCLSLSIPLSLYIPLLLVLYTSLSLNT
jgi:hypothetical protein